MLVAEGILLLIADDETGKVVARYPDLVVAGGLLTDLALAGNVRLTEAGESIRKNRVVSVADAQWPADPLLSATLTMIGRKERWYTSTLVEWISAHQKPLAAVYRRLAQAEVLSRVDHRALGLIPIRRWVSLDDRHENELRAQLDEVFLFDAEPDPHTAALAALLAAAGVLAPVLDRGRKLDRTKLKRRGKEFLGQYWTAQATERAMQGRDGAAG